MQSIISKPSFGLFVTIEGPNCSGKTTLANRLFKKLETLYPGSVLLTQEPTEDEFGKYVKNCEKTISGEAYALLIAANRMYHVEKVIKPAIRQHKIVICARYIESSLVLQGFDGVDESRIWEINKTILKPNLCIELRSSSETLKKRLSQRNSLSRFEQTMEREEELKRYSEAISFLRTKNFNLLLLNNEDQEDEEKCLGKALRSIFDLLDH